MAWTDAARAASAAVRRAHAKGRSQVVYHGTSATSVVGIKKYGLRPMKNLRVNSSALYKGARGRAVFVTKSAKDAMNYGKAQAAAIYSRLPANQRKIGRIRYMGKTPIYRPETVRYAVVKLKVPTRLLRQDRSGAHSKDFRIDRGLSKRHIAGIKTAPYRVYRSWNSLK